MGDGPMPSYLRDASSQDFVVDKSWPLFNSTKRYKEARRTPGEGCGGLGRCAMNEELAAEMEDKFGLHISIVATEILKQEIGLVMALPRVQ
jgi:hypothetical protein